MRTAYKIVAHLISLAVVVQAAVVAWSMFEAIALLQRGIMPAGPPFAAILHGNIGMYVVPVLAIALVAIALFAHAGLKWALLTLLAVALQIALAFAAFGAPWLGMLHGINAFAVLALAEVAAYSMAHAEVSIRVRRHVAYPAA
ncbi:hypothetical protein ACFY5D_06945 [Paeniglutamicibacter sp. NPDC012692]|uniref:hypothetical protein n=1 Tax=Paeniglutamicibacter sp. NPDC012692 TaxID=3364388 RepID=UPI003681F4B6